MKNFCQGCGKYHEDCNWKYIGGVWICSEHFNPSPPSEMVPESIKEERKEYFNSTVQPFRQGELSKEYIEAHGTKGLNVTKDEVKKARYVWKDLDGWGSRDKSK